MRAMTHSYAMQPDHVECVHVTRHHDSFIYVPWRIDMCAVSRSYAMQPEHIECVRDMCSWRIDMCAMTQTYVCHDTIICVPW